MDTSDHSIPEPAPASMSAAARHGKSDSPTLDTAGIQQAKKPDSQLQFLQIAAKPRRGVRNVETKPEPKLTRVTFAVSRLMEFCSERELQCPATDASSRLR
jgi:hypothetical protein